MAKDYLNKKSLKILFDNFGNKYREKTSTFYEWKRDFAKEILPWMKQDPEQNKKTEEIERLQTFVDCKTYKENAIAWGKILIRHHVKIGRLDHGVLQDAPDLFFGALYFKNFLKQERPPYHENINPNRDPDAEFYEYLAISILFENFNKICGALDKKGVHHETNTDYLSCLFKWIEALENENKHRSELWEYKFHKGQAEEDFENWKRKISKPGNQAKTNRREQIEEKIAQEMIKHFAPPDEEGNITISKKSFRDIFEKHYGDTASDHTWKVNYKKAVEGILSKHHSITTHIQF